jgi:hypothetical protein
MVPDLDRAALPAEARRLAEELLTLEWDALAGMEVVPAVVTPLVRFLQSFLVFQLGRLPRGRAEALGVGCG